MSPSSRANTPDDWAAHWRRCTRCGQPWHASEPGCECEWWADVTCDGEEMMPVEPEPEEPDEA